MQNIIYDREALIQRSERMHPHALTAYFGMANVCLEILSVLIIVIYRDYSIYIYIYLIFICIYNV